MKQAFVDSQIVLAELTIRPDRLEAFLDYVVESLQASRSYPGNIAFDILIDEADPDRVRFYEVWDSPTAQQAYMAWRVQAGDLTTLLSFLTEPPKVTLLRRTLVP